MTSMFSCRLVFIALAGAVLGTVVSHSRAQDLAIRGQLVYTMAGEPLADGVVLVAGGKIRAVGPAASTPIPAGCRVLEAAVVTPGLIDGHATAGLTGIYNIPHDQDQHESSAAIQPELRAIDAVNVQEDLIGWLRGFGITTLHTGHASGELVAGQTMVIKTIGETVDDAQVSASGSVVAVLGPAANRVKGSPGTRGKQIAMLRQELIRAREYLAEWDRFRAKEAAGQQDASEAPASGQRDPAGADDSDPPETDREKGPAKPPARDLRLEALGAVLRREVPLMVTANRAQDIASALRLAEEFQLRLWLDGAAESYLLVDQIRAAGVPVILHPPMIRAVGEYENMSFETAGKLVAAGIPVVLQSGFEGYVPKTRVVLFEAAIAAANGLTREQALATITRDAARLLGIDQRVGTLEPGKDADLALYDGDPFEYTTHCIGVVINGRVASEERR